MLSKSDIQGYLAGPVWHEQQQMLQALIESNQTELECNDVLDMVEIAKIRGKIIVLRHLYDMGAAMMQFQELTLQMSEERKEYERQGKGNGNGGNAEEYI